MPSARTEPLAVGDGDAHLWNLTTRKTTTFYGTTMSGSYGVTVRSGVKSVAFSPDGTLFAGAEEALTLTDLSSVATGLDFGVHLSARADTSNVQQAC